MSRCMKLRAKYLSIKTPLLRQLKIVTYSMMKFNKCKFVIILQYFWELICQHDFVKPSVRIA